MCSGNCVRVTGLANQTKKNMRQSTAADGFPVAKKPAGKLEFEVPKAVPEMGKPDYRTPTREHCIEWDDFFKSKDEVVNWWTIHYTCIWKTQFV